ncbi:MAG: hypothetical protein H7A00_09665 [Hahellaceae bacterium]|nr:hypothetical protein [Hahellaceae bacterium]
MGLEKIDTSYWLTKDKAWMEERKAQWPVIEKVVECNRRKSEVNMIKQYFLRGTMPKWEKYRDWDDLYRHLDLNLFLWLHPSSDLDVLKGLYKNYMESDLIHEKDVLLGYALFLKHELMMATSPYKSLEDYPFPFMGEKNIILFRILFEDLDYAKSQILRLLGSQESFDKKARHIFEFLGYHHFLRMWLWLLQDSNSPLMLNCLYQYDDVVEWCMTTVTTNSEKEFLKEIAPKAGLKEYQKALYCIHHFDTEKEGDTCRTRAVHKIRKILDEREFIPEFKQMWLDVKAGKVEVKNPWRR